MKRQALMSPANRLWAGFLPRFRSAGSRANSSTMSTNSLPDVPPNVPVEEEVMPDYDSKLFHPTNPGDELDGRYKVLGKLGWGSSSTVWLAKETSRWPWRRSRFVTLKIAVSGDKKAAEHERILCSRLETNTTHKGYRFVRSPIDYFDISGPHGPYPCLVFEPMRETMQRFQQRLPGGKIPGPLLKLYIQHLLLGLDYLHSECRVVHTDLKQDNIMMGIEDPAVLKEYAESVAEPPAPLKVGADRSVYRSQGDFGTLWSFRMLPKIADFGLAQLPDGPEPLRYPIQPPLFHAPEVILGVGWSFSADIWNLGVLLWNLLENRNMLPDIRTDGVYDARKHLGALISLLGDPPQELLAREENWAMVPWKCPFLNPEGRPSWTAREFFGGPFFGPKGDFFHRDLVPAGFTLDSIVSSLEGDDKALFVDFAGQMLRWLPEERKTARELLDHPWLGIK